MTKKVQTDLFGTRMPDFVEPEFDGQAPKPKGRPAAKGKPAVTPKAKATPKLKAKPRAKPRATPKAVADPGWMAEMAEILEPAMGLDGDAIDESSVSLSPEVSGSSSLRFYAGTSTSPQCLTYYNRQRGWCACAGVEAQRAPSG